MLSQTHLKLNVDENLFVQPYFVLRNPSLSHLKNGLKIYLKEIHASQIISDKMQHLLRKVMGEKTSYCAKRCLLFEHLCEINYDN